MCVLPFLPACGGGGGDGTRLADNGPDEGPTPGYAPRVLSAWTPKGDPDVFRDAFRDLMEASTDFSWLTRGDRVFLKLALNSGNPYPATTDPWALEATIQILREKGAGEILVGDQSSAGSVFWTPSQQRGSSRAHCESSGLLQVIQEAGATPHFFEEAGYDAYFPATPPGSHHWTDPIWIASILQDVDHVIYLPRTASHVMGEITSGMKLGVGFLREDSRRIFHQGGDDFYAMYEEINRVPQIAGKLRLIVNSSRRVLSVLGPDAGYITEPDHGLIFASTDLLAHELLSLAWLRWNRENETPAFTRNTMGQITRNRAEINRSFVTGTWQPGADRPTPDIPLWQAGDIYEHPAILNSLQFGPGTPEQLVWDRLSQASQPDDAVVEELRGHLKV